MLWILQRSRVDNLAHVKSGTGLDLWLVNTEATVSKVARTRRNDLTIFVVGVSQRCVGQQGV